MSDEIQSAGLDNSANDIEQSSEQPKEQPNSPAPTKRKLKANGRELEVDDTELERLASLGLGAHEKFNEAAKLRKEHEEMMKKIESDPLSFIKSKVPKFRELAEEFLYEQIQQESMSPEARKAQELEEQLKKYKEQEEEQKKQSEEAQNKQLDERYAKEYEQSLIKALQSADMPRDPYVVSKIVKVMSDAMEEEVELSFEEAASLVKHNTIAEIQHFLSKVEDLPGFLGEELSGKFRKSDLAKIKKTGNTRSPEENAPPPKENNQKFRGVDDLKAALMKDLSKDS